MLPLLALLTAPNPGAAQSHTLTGYLEPYRFITIAAAEPGVLKEVLVKEGDRVKKNQIVARLDTAQIEAELEIAEAEAKLQATRLQRFEELESAYRTTPDELDKARTDSKIKGLQVRRIRAILENRLLRSPINGIVTEIKRDPSESVSAANPHVLTVVEIDKLGANLFLSPSRADGLSVGQKVSLLLPESQERPAAEVEFISPTTDVASGTVRVKLVIENAEGKWRSGTPCVLP